MYGKRQESRQWSAAMVRQLGCELNSEILKAVESVVRPLISGEMESPGAIFILVAAELNLTHALRW